MQLHPHWTMQFHGWSMVVNACDVYAQNNVKQTWQTKKTTAYIYYYHHLYFNGLTVIFHVILSQPVPLTFLPPLVPEQNLPGNKWHFIFDTGIFRAWCPSSHPTNRIKTLNPTSSKVAWLDLLRVHGPSLMQVLLKTEYISQHKFDEIRKMYV